MFLAAHTQHDSAGGLNIVQFTLLFYKKKRDRDLLTEDGVTHTSGSTGLHDLIPMNGFISAP